MTILDHYSLYLRAMASLSSSWESANVVIRTCSPGDQLHSPTSRSTSPVPKAGDTATNVAFRNARDTYRKSLSEKDMKRIMIPTGPEDVVNEIERWQKKHSDSKFAAGIRAGLARLQRFSASIDMLAQGTPDPGCLLWGSIKFVLTVSSLYIHCSVSFLSEHRHLRTNQQRCQALSRILIFAGNLSNKTIFCSVYVAKSCCLHL